jgi:hypothetical protein
MYETTQKYLSCNEDALELWRSPTATALLNQTLDTLDICFLAEAEQVSALVLHGIALCCFVELPIPFPLPLHTTPAFFAAFLLLPVWHPKEIHFLSLNASSGLGPLVKNPMMRQRRIN